MVGIGRGFQTVWAVWGSRTREGKARRDQVCSDRVFLTDRESSCTRTMGKCELIGKAEGKLRQHRLPHEWLSRCWRTVVLVP